MEEKKSKLPILVAKIPVMRKEKMKLQIPKGTEELDLGTVLPLTKKEEDVEE